MRYFGHFETVPATWGYCVLNLSPVTTGMAFYTRSEMTGHPDDHVYSSSFDIEPGWWHYYGVIAPWTGNDTVEAPHWGWDFDHREIYIDNKRGVDPRWAAMWERLG